MVIELFQHTKVVNCCSFIEKLCIIRRSICEAVSLVVLSCIVHVVQVFAYYVVTLVQFCSYRRCVLRTGNVK